MAGVFGSGVGAAMACGFAPKALGCAGRRGGSAIARRDSTPSSLAERDDGGADERWRSWGGGGVASRPAIALRSRACSWSPPPETPKSEMSESTSACDGDGSRELGSNCIVGISFDGAGVAFLRSSSGIWPRAVVGSSSRENVCAEGRCGGGSAAWAAGYDASDARRDDGTESLDEGRALRPTPRVTRRTSLASRASARRPAARFTGMSAISSSSASAGSPARLRRLPAAARAGVCDPLASSKRVSIARIESSAPPAGPSRRGFTSATVPSSLTKTAFGSTSPPLGSACSAISRTR